MLDYQNLSDQELISFLKTGDKEAFAEIYNRYKGVLYSHVCKKTADVEEAKDLLQDVFINLWIKRKELPVFDNLSGYLYTSIKNKLFTKISKKGVEDKYIQSFQSFISNSYNTDSVFREKELNLLLEKELDKLPSKMRKIFILSRSFGLPHKEIANQLGIAEQTVTKQIYYALKVLRLKVKAIIS